MVVVVFRKRYGVTRGLTSGDDAYLVHCVAMLQKLGDDCVAAFVISGDAFVGFGDDAALFLRAGDNFVYRFVDVVHYDCGAVVSRGKDSRFIQKVFDVCARETSRQPCKRLKVDVRRKRFVAAVNSENGLSALDVRNVNVNLTIKSARPQKRLIQNVGTVGCSHNDDAFVFLEAVHLNE